MARLSRPPAARTWLTLGVNLISSASTSATANESPLLPKPAHSASLFENVKEKAGGDNAPARSCFLPLASLPVGIPACRPPAPASVLSSQTGPGARPVPMRSERDAPAVERAGIAPRSEEHTSELQSLMRISYAV